MDSLLSPCLHGHMLCGSENSPFWNTEACPYTQQIPQLRKKVAIRQNTTTLAKESDRIEQLQNTLIIYPESQKCCSTLIITSQKTLQSITRKRHQVKSLKQNNPNEKVNHSAEIQYSKANSHICDTPM